MSQTLLVVTAQNMTEFLYHDKEYIQSKVEILGATASLGVKVSKQ